MANAVPSRLGLNTPNGVAGSDNNELFLKLWSGEVLTTFNANTVMKERTRTRKITNGKSYQFPAIGKIDAEYHTAGSEITGSSVDHSEVVITIDDLLISHSFISNIDEAKNHYSVRSEYSKQMGQALAQTFDRNVLSLAAANVLTPPTKTLADMDTSEAVSLGGVTTSTALLAAFYTAAEKLDGKNVASEGRFAIVPPAIYYKIVQDDKILNRDFSGGNGDYSDGKVLRVAGIEIVKSNNMAINHTTTGTGVPNLAKYDVDASGLNALILTPQAIGCVQLMDVASEAEYDIRRQGTLMVSKMAVGHGILRPECMIGITAA